jgi:hypothetical protein
MIKAEKYDCFYRIFRSETPKLRLKTDGKPGSIFSSIPVSFTFLAHKWRSKTLENRRSKQWLTQKNYLAL